MLNSYKARIDEGEHINWLGKVPSGLSRGRSLDVEICLVSKLITSKQHNGKKMAEILENLAALNATEAISDPVAWQREVRMEHPLIGRK